MSYSDSSLDSSADENVADAAYPRKRRKQSKESRMLGIFGSDSDGQDSSSRRNKPRYLKPVSFERPGDQSSLDSDELDQESDHVTAQSAQSADRVSSREEMPRTDNRSTIQLEHRPRFGTFQDSTDAHLPRMHASQSTQTTWKRDSPPASINRPPKQEPHKTASSDQVKTSKLQSSIGARMMAKMGHKQGQGLGASGTGIVAPVEANLRPGQKAGLGSVDERTASGAVNERHDKTRHVSAEKVASKHRPNKPKVKYKTAREIAAEAGGVLPIPEKLQSIVDMTGHEPRRITHLKDLGKADLSKGTIEKHRISHQARDQLEHYARKWQTLQEQKLYYLAETQRQQTELETAIQEHSKLEALQHKLAEVVSLSELPHDDHTAMERIASDLEALQDSLALVEAQQPNLDEFAIALLTPSLRDAISTWSVLEEPGNFRDALSRLSKILRIERSKEAQTSANVRRQAIPYESFMATVWFGQVRSALTIPWTPRVMDKVLLLLELWDSLTPTFLRTQIISQLVIPKLISCINGLQFGKDDKSSTLYRLLQWFPYLSAASQDLVSHMKHRLSLALSRWQPEDGLLRDMDVWSEVLGATQIHQLLQRHVLPKLAQYLRMDLRIEPANQSLFVLDNVLIWSPTIAPSLLAEVLKTELFSKWLRMLYEWLQDDPDLDEISQWYEWWQDVLPKEISNLPPIQESFTKGLLMMETTLEHGPQALLAPAVGPAKPIDHDQNILEKRKSRRAAIIQDDQREITFKDAVEDWCAKHNYILFPLRKAHESGNALFKITNDSTGAGGVTIYLRGDVVMMQGSVKAQYSPTSLAEIAAQIG